MTIAHLADTHLGFRSYPRTTPQGFNQREQDVLDTFRACLDAIGEREPDVVVHAGDMFHVVRPSNATIVGAYRAVDVLQRKRKGKPFVLIGGNHDTPRTADSGNILRLFEAIPGVHVRSGAAEFLSNDDPGLKELDLEVMCVPFRGLDSENRPKFRPTGARTNSILVLHGMAREALPDHAQIEIAQTCPTEWSYVALGDYHGFQPFGPNVCYSGSIDYTSSNIWEERHIPKGWVWFDSAVGVLEPVPVPTREVIDLEPIEASLLQAEDIDDALALNAEWGEGLPIVRQRVRDVFSSVRPKLNLKVQREIGARALHYQLVLESPQSEFDSDLHGEGRPASLEESWLQHAAQANLPAGVDRSRLQSVGLHLLKEVVDVETDSAEA